MAAIELTLPYQFQREILNDPARFKVVVAGRRIGKTELGKIVVADTAIRQKEQVYWFAPSYQMASQIWRELKATFRPIIKWKSEQDRIIELHSGGELRVFSAEKFDRIRGLNPKTVIFDEAAMMTNPDIWYGATRPSLSDKIGNAYFLTTPRGRNWLYDIYINGKEQIGGYKSWTAPTWTNPYIPKSEIIQAMDTYPERLFAQEYRAEFLLDAAGVFSGVALVCTGFYQDPYQGNFSMGVDLARKNDYTVISIFDIDARQQVYMERINAMDWKVIRQRIADAYNSWNPKQCWIEENNVGDVIVQDMRDMGLKVIPFYTLNQNKAEIIQRLAIDIKNQKVELLNDRDLLIEFQAFSMDITKSGKISYSAPNGFHDDIVMATAMAYQGISNGIIVVGGGLRTYSGWR